MKQHDHNLFTNNFTHLTLLSFFHAADGCIGDTKMSNPSEQVTLPTMSLLDGRDATPSTTSPNEVSSSPSVPTEYTMIPLWAAYMIVRQENPLADRRALYQATKNHMKFISHIVENKSEENLVEEEVYFLTELQQLDINEYTTKRGWRASDMNHGALEVEGQLRVGGAQLPGGGDEDEAKRGGRAFNINHGALKVEGQLRVGGAQLLGGETRTRQSAGGVVLISMMER